jgi:hypothetical protein
MNIQMRIITEDNIDQLTSMNYAKTIENLKLTKLTKKEGEDYNKKYESINIRSREKPKTTKQIIEQEQAQEREQAQDQEKKPEIIDLAEKGALEEKPTNTDEDDDNEGLSQVTIDSIKRAEDEFSRYQDIDEDENELIKIGDVVNSDELGIEDLNVEKSIIPKKQQEQQQPNTNTNTNSVSKTIQVQKEPTLLENITSNTPSSVDKANNEKSENMKTIVIKDQ